VAPDVYELNSDGFNEMAETEVSLGREDQARRGARACPERAIAILDDPA
jgi:ferredoxin